MTVLAACSDLPSALNDPGEPEPVYAAMVAQNFKLTFSQAPTFTNVAISGARRVLYTKGWSWLVCLQYEADGRRRVYAFFIKGNAVIDSRYAVRTDECDRQQYAPFDLGTGSTAAPSVARPPISLEPLY